MTAALASTTMIHAATIDEIKGRGYLLVASEDNCRPFAFTEEGKATGYDNEFLVLGAVLN